MAGPSVAAVDGEVLLVVVGELADGPDVEGRGCGHGIQDVAGGAWVGTGYLGPFRPVPVQDQGSTDRAGVVGTHRPGVVRAGGGRTPEGAVPGGGAGLPGPFGSGPGKDQCPVYGAVEIPADRPGLPAGGAGRDSVQVCVTGGPTGVGAGLPGPLLAVPVHDEALIRGA